MNTAEQCLAADCLQRPLVPRSRFRQQLKAGVDMTSAVKRGSIVSVTLRSFSPPPSGRVGASNRDGGSR
jgi:hypothetical protein